MQAKGILTKWNDDRGFGFIKHGETEMVFVHISAVKMMPRRPREGDTLFYDLILDSSGKKKAACVTIEGLEKVPLYTPKKSKSRNTLKANSPYIMLIIILVIVFVYFKNGHSNLAERYLATPIFSERPQDIEIRKQRNRFSCQGKTHCSQMTSCEEAMFYLGNCPNQNTDGDGDGEPCENQWCR